MLLITGATGTIGSDVVRNLVQQGAPVRGLARNPDKAAALQIEGVEWVKGDLGEPETLDAALAGVETAFLLPPVHPDAVAHQKNFVEAAKRSRLQRIVKLSSFGADPKTSMTFGRWHGEGERLVEESGIAYTILRPNSFMQNILASAPTIQGQGRIFQPAGDATISHIDTRDIAAVAAKTLTDSGHEGKTYDLTGPEGLTFFQVAEIFSSVLGKPVTYVPVPPEGARQGMIGAGLEEWRVNAILELFELYRSGEGGEVTGWVRQITGKAPIAYQRFVEDYASAF
jgi:uncharacterized protein YbjT (DUF2867 family)